MPKPHRRSLVAPIREVQPSIEQQQQPQQPQQLQQLQTTSSASRIKKRSDLSILFHSMNLIINILFLALTAVVIIQTWFRRRRALFEIRRKTAWTIYQHIEYAGEQDQLKVFHIFKLIFMCVCFFFFEISFTISSSNLCKLLQKIRGMPWSLRKSYVELLVFQA
jgi:hypothetical protein